MRARRTHQDDLPRPRVPTYRVGVRPAAVQLAADLAAALRAAAERAAPREFVALLAGSTIASAAGDSEPSDRSRPGAATAVVRSFHELRNSATDDAHYEVTAAAFAEAEARARADGQRFLGFVHSHPHGRAQPSTTDRAHWWRQCLQLVLGRCDRDVDGGQVDGNGSGDGGDLRAFWCERSDTFELPLRIAPLANARAPLTMEVR